MAIEASPEVFNTLLSKLGAPACYEVGILDYVRLGLMIDATVTGP